MTRDEWVVLPIAGQVERRRFRREDIGDYWPRQFPDGEAVMLMRRHTDLLFTITLPLAEFEALLFGSAPSASDDYTRAGMAWAEAAAVLERESEAWVAASLDADSTAYDAAAEVEEAARDAFLRLYRERHGG